jgi:hypothetical protein
MVSETSKEFTYPDGTTVRSIYEVICPGVKSQRVLKLVRKYLYKPKKVELKLLYEYKGMFPTLYNDAKVIRQHDMKILD